MKLNTLFLALSIAFGLAPVSLTMAADNEAASALHGLFDREWDRNMRENPITASSLGDYRFNDLWPDVSLQAITHSHEQDQQALADLAKIDRAALGQEDQVNYDLFQYQYKD